MTSINLENLDYNFLVENNNKKIDIIINNETFHFQLNLKYNNEKLMVFSNGAVNRDKKEPPLFMRSSWHEEVNANCIFIDDKTIHNSNIPIGWGVGPRDRHFILDYVMVVKKIAGLINIRNKDIFYYGSSAGGFMSILMSVEHKFTTAIANNPQTSVMRYRERHRRLLFNKVFKGMSEDEIVKEFGERISLIDAINNENYVPRIYYLQNALYEFDMEQHFNPFVDEMKNSGLSTRKITYILYNNEKLGHDPLPKNETLKYINSLLEF